MAGSAAECNSLRQLNESFNILYLAERDPIHSYFLLRIFDRSTADDLSAIVFEALWKHIEEVGRLVEPRVWIFQTARRTLHNYRRTLSRQQRLQAKLRALSLQRNVYDPEWRSTDDSSLTALQPLSERDREALRLVYWDGFNRREAADILGVTPGTFDVLIHRARARYFRELQARSHPF